MPPQLISITIGFLILALAFTLLERWLGHGKERPFFRRGYGLDVAYWFFTPLVTKSLTKLVIYLPAILLISAGVVSADQLRAGGYHGFGPLSHQPLWLQSVEILALADLLGYASHRLFHGRRWWPFHAVHHSSEDLDWLSSIRVHPVNDLVNKFAQVVPLVLIGLDPSANVKVAVFFTLYAIFLHANVNWDFGPFRYVIASPNFHRWHHSREPEAMDKNFAGLLPVWDILFGTFYMPRDRAPQNFGIHGPMSSTLWGQLIHPFKKSGTGPSVS